MKTSNKIIAKFMNYANNKPLTDSLLLTLYKDWESIMKVVEKIESLLPDDSFVTIEHKSCWIPIYDDEQPFGIECREETKKQAVYNACIEFIKWYNENSAKEK